jgi:hypothetical protein
VETESANDRARKPFPDVGDGVLETRGTRET